MAGDTLAGCAKKEGLTDMEIRNIIKARNN